MMEVTETGRAASAHTGRRRQSAGKAAGMLRLMWRHKIISIIACILVFAGFEYATLPGEQEFEVLKRSNPRTTQLIEQRKEEARREGRTYRIRQQWVHLEDVSQNLIHAMIVSEDGTFFEHEGIDWFEVKESIKKDIQRGKFVRGASTITQQLAKNLYLSTSKDPMRKLREIYIATSMEDVLSKRRILEIYLNIIEWGNGIFGIEAASLASFGKHASELSREESARLAAVVPSPLRHSPGVDSKFVTYRTRLILERMSARGW